VVKDSPERQRFELEVDGHLAFSAYRRASGVVTFTHTEVPDVFRGKGIGSALAQGALELVRQSGERAVARCPFIAAYIARHPEFSDLVAEPQPGA
jgi:predicted GNAT family acetyltransferase